MEQRTADGSRRRRLRNFLTEIGCAFGLDTDEASRRALEVERDLFWGPVDVDGTPPPPWPY